jgi:hypothetical protein
MGANPRHRPIREVVSARYRARAQVWLLGMFVLLRLAEGADWVFFTGALARQQLPGGYSQEEVIGWLAATALLTTAMLVGLWFRQRWVRGIFKIALVAQLILTGIVMAWAVHLWAVFPMSLFLAATLRLAVLWAISFAKDIRLFLSVAYFDTYA